MMYAALVPCERRIIAFAAPRGGIGKSTVVRQLARLLSREDDEGRAQRRVLCLDFDRERGGLATVFEPKAVPGRPGWMSLILDALELDDTRWNAAVQRLSCDASDSVLRPVDDLESMGRLFYLPAFGAPSLRHTGSVDADPATHQVAADDDERTKTELLALEAARVGPMWEALGKEPATSAARTRLSQVRDILRRQFDYVLMDLEAGPTAFELAASLLPPDATVVLFRPVVSQLMASASLAFRAYLASANEDPRFVPVVPLLTHRPALADRRIATIREIGKQDVFPWLADETELMGPHWHELPYDAGAAVDESPVSMADEWDPLLDPQSPFCVALIALCGTLRQLNAGADPTGADDVASQLLLDGLPGQAARYVAAAIRAEPSYLPRWRALGRTFVGHCERDAQVFAVLAKLAEDFALAQETSSVDARCYAQLWLGEAELRRHAQAARRRLEDLWAWSTTKELSPRVRADVLKVIAGHDSRVPANAGRTVPNAAVASRQRLAILVNELRPRSATPTARPQWSATEAPEQLAACLLAYARNHATDCERAKDALFDVMRIGVAPEISTRAQWLLAETLAQHGRESEALAAHLEGAGADTVVKHDAQLRLIRFLSLLAPGKQVFEQVAQLQRAEDSASWRAWATLRVSREVGELEGAISTLRDDSDDLDGNLIYGVCRAILRDAVEPLSERAERLFAVLPTRARWGIGARAVREFAAWTERLAPFSEDVQRWAEQFDPVASHSPFDLRAVLFAAISPDEFDRVVQAAAPPAMLTQRQCLAFLRAQVTLDSKVQLNAWQGIRFERSGLPGAFHRIHERRNDHEHVKRLALASWQAATDAAPYLIPDAQFRQQVRDAADAGGDPEAETGIDYTQVAAKWHDALAAIAASESVPDGPRLTAELAMLSGVGDAT